MSLACFKMSCKILERLFLFAEFNLGPLFALDQLVEKMYNLNPRQYTYSRTATGKLSTHFSRLADTEEGSSVKTYRKRQVDKAHLPLNVWK